MRDLLLRHCPNAHNIVVIHHGFDAAEMRRMAQSPKLPAGANDWAQQGVRLLHVSHPGPHKNLPFLAKVLAQIASKRPDVSLAVTFRGTENVPEVSAFVDEASRLNVLDHISFLGPLTQTVVAPLYAQANVVLYPSLTESFGFPLLEALSVGTPVVASRIPSNLEIAGEVASFHDPGDPDEATAQILSAAGADAADYRLRRQQRVAAFSWAKHCESVAELISGVVSR
jgi:glycosyltransferase involved in cell wall biosynthesis